MNQTISCPECNVAITLNQLFWTASLLRFKCPHCGTRVQPKDKGFVTGWLLIASVVGLFVGLAAPMTLGLARDAAGRGLVYIGLVLLGVGAIAVIKWRASLALIKKGELKVAN